MRQAPLTKTTKSLLRDLANDDVLRAALTFDIAQVRAALARGAFVDYMSAQGRSALHIAAAHGFIEILELLLGAGADFNLRTTYEFTALHLAADAGHVPCVKALLRAGTWVDVVDQYGSTPLHRAADNGHAAVLDVLIAAGANATRRTANGLSTLHLAAGNGDAACVVTLARAGVALNGLDKDGSTPLHRAAAAGHHDAVAKLCYLGADATVVNRFGEMAYDQAPAEHRAALWRYTQEQLVARDRLTKLLHDAARAGDCAAAIEAIEAGAHVNAVDGDEYTVLDVAVANPHLRAVLRARGAVYGRDLPAARTQHAH